MNFSEALEAADVPEAERHATRLDAHDAWLAVAEPLEVPAIRAVLRGLITVEQIRAAIALGGDFAALGLLESVGACDGVIA